jgi:hypothetical protein
MFVLTFCIILLIFVGLSYYSPSRPIRYMETEITCSAINCTAGIALQNKSGVNYITISDEVSKHKEYLDRGPQTIRQGI